MTISQEAIEAAEREFTEYFVRNYPGPDTIIFDPKWHAPKLFRAATHSLLSTLPIAVEGKVKALATYDAGLLNDWGGGNVAWWQDYIRDELGRAHEFYADQFATAPISPDELLSLIPDEIDIPPMTDRGVAGQVLDVAWPLCGGNHQDGDFWSVFSFAVALTLRVSSPGKDGGQEVEAVAISVEGSPLLEWAVDQWKRQVGGRPLRNVHRRSLDDVWRQVVRWAGGDPDKLVGPPHDELLAMESKR